MLDMSSLPLHSTPPALLQRFPTIVRLHQVQPARWASTRLWHGESVLHGAQWIGFEEYLWLREEL